MTIESEIRDIITRKMTQPRPPLRVHLRTDDIQVTTGGQKHHDRWPVMLKLLNGVNNGEKGLTLGVMLSHDEVDAVIEALTRAKQANAEDEVKVGKDTA